MCVRLRKAAQRVSGRWVRFREASSSDGQGCKHDDFATGIVQRAQMCHPSEESSFPKHLFRPTQQEASRTRVHAAVHTAAGTAKTGAHPLRSGCFQKHGLHESEPKPESHHRLSFNTGQHTQHSTPSKLTRCSPGLSYSNRFFTFTPICTISLLSDTF